MVQLHVTRLQEEVRSIASSHLPCHLPLIAVHVHGHIDSHSPRTMQAKAWPSIRPTGFQLLCPVVGDAAGGDPPVWTAFVPGPRGTPFDGGLFVVRLAFPRDYPNSAPVCTFVPPLFHPNVAPSGRVLLSILDPSHWDPRFHVKTVLMGACPHHYLQHLFSLECYVAE